MFLSRVTVSKIANTTADRSLEIFLDAMIKANKDVDVATLELLIKATVDNYFKGRKNGKI